MLESFSPGQFMSGGIVVDFSNPNVVINPGSGDQFAVKITHDGLHVDREPVWVVESGPGTLTFEGESLIEEHERIDWTQYTFTLSQPTAIEASDGGSFEPFHVQIIGPTALGDIPCEKESPD